MKRLLFATLCAVLTVSLAGCNSAATIAPTPNASAPTVSATPTPEPTPTPEDPAIIQQRKAAIIEADRLALEYDYDAALERLSTPAIYNEEIDAEIAEIQAAQNTLIPFTGTIKHIFFHSLIVYPELIFRDKTTPMGGYNAGFSEKAELEKILPQLYERGYVLYDLGECYEMVDGKMQRKEILLPPGKEPLILSVDDVAYAYGKGYAQNLMLNEDGILVNQVKNPQGEIEEMVDGDVFGVIKLFVDEHPDFSYHGHKGTLAMTGYQGAFGYSFETAEGQSEIMKVADALRKEGWNFASHSFTHNRKNYFGPNSQPANIARDTLKWMNQVSPYLGTTNLYLAPFGYRVRQPGLQHILDAGFQIYCTVNSKFVNEVYDDYALMSRLEIGGYSMTYYRDVLNEHFFNVDKVFDAEGRPPVIG